jgi:hypothetical protein
VYATLSGDSVASSLPATLHVSGNWHNAAGVVHRKLCHAQRAEPQAAIALQGIHWFHSSVPYITLPYGMWQTVGGMLVVVLFHRASAAGKGQCRNRQ